MSGRELGERLAVIVVDYKAPHGLLKRCRKSVDKHTPDGTQVVWHDNAKLNENLGALWNRLIRELPESRDLVLLLNPDAELTEGCLDEMAEALDYRQKVGAVGPCGNVRTVQNHPNPDELPRFHVVPDLSGFCVLINREAFDHVLEFREDYPLYGQDTDLFARMRRNGWVLIWATEAYCEHEGGACVEQARLHGELESEDAVRGEAQRYFQRHGMHLPDVLQFAADYVPDGGSYIARSAVRDHMRDLRLALRRANEQDGVEVTEITQYDKIKDVPEDLRTLVWYSQGMSITEDQVESDAKLYRWAVVFEDVETFEQRDIGELLTKHWGNVHLETVNAHRVAVCVSRPQTVALTVLAKNEGGTIERTLRSYAWDRMIVGIDNATTDNTREVVEACGVPPEDIWSYDFVDLDDLERLKAEGVPASEWDQHVGFAALRNESLRRSADCDWMIFVDGHEFLEPASTSYLEHVLTFQAPRVRAGFVTIVHGTRTFQYTRMMRPKTAVHFTGVFHNDLGGYSESTAAVLAPIRLIHDRPERVTKGRRDQVKNLNTIYFQAMLDEDPNDDRALFYLGSALMGSGKEKEAAVYWRRYVDLDDPGEGYRMTHNPQKYQALLYLGVLALQRGDFAEAWEMSMRCFRYDPTRNEHLIMLGDVAMNCNEFAEAAQWYTIATVYDMPTSVMFVRRRSYQGLPYICKARAHVRMGDITAAINAVGEALRKDPHDQEASDLMLAIRRHQRGGNGTPHEDNVKAVTRGRDLAHYECQG